MRFSGKLGFGTTDEDPPGSGIHVDQIVERSYFGDVVRNTRLLHEGENLNKDLSVSNMISLVADAYANENFQSIRYVEWNGQRWTISYIEVQRPRLVMQLGEVYHGPTP